MNPQSQGQYIQSPSYDQASLLSHLGAYPASQSSAPANTPSTQQPQAQPQDNEQWWQKILPTVGGIALPLLGAALAPETGGLSLLASTALGAGGSALGKGIENATAGKDFNAGDLLNSGAEGAVGSLMGGGLGKVLGAGGKVIGNIGEKGLASEAATKSAQGALEAAQATKNTFAGVKPSLLKANDLAGTQQLATKLGVDANSPEALVQTGTAANDILNDTVNGVLAKNGGVDTTGLHGLFKSAIAKNSGTLGTADPVALSRGRIGLSNTPAAKLYQQLQDLSAGIANRADADPTELRQMISKVGSLAADAKPGISATTGAVDPTQKATYNTLNDIYGQLKKTLYERPNVASDVAALKGGILPEDVGGSEVLANHLNEAISGAQTPQELLDHLSKFTGMSKIGTAGVEAAKNPATAAAVATAKAALPETEGGIAQVPGTALGNAVASSSHPVGKLLGAALNIGSKGGAAAHGAVNLGSVLSRIAPIVGTVAGQTVANAPNYTPNPVAPGSFQTGQDNGVNPMQPQGQSPTQQALEIAMNSARNPYLQANAFPLLQQLTGQTQQATTGEAALQSLEQAYQGAGGGQGMIGGLLAKLGGTLTGNNVSAYDAQRQQAMQVLSKLGIPVSALPDVTNTNPAAMSQFQNIQNVLSSING